MKYAEANLGRTFILRLENGEIVHEVLENFAREQSINAASLIIVGGVNKDSKLVVGPGDGNERPIHPMTHILKHVHEVFGTGTLFPDEDGNPILHMHISCGRNTSTITGCIREGIITWQILEVIVFELLNTSSVRISDTDLGFKILNP